MEHPDLLQTMEAASKEKSATNHRMKGGKQTSVEEKMKAHNKKFNKKKHLYEPRKHSARDVRKWEAKTKKKWSSLDVEGRIEANAEITKMITARTRE